MDAVTDMSLDVFMNAVLTAAQGGDGLVLLGLGLMGLIWVSRKWAIKVVPFFATDFGGMVFAFATSTLTVVAATLVSGAAIGMPLVTAALTSGLIAVGGWSGVLKKIPGINKSE